MTIVQHNVTLAIFSCEGRGHLLTRTIQKFEDACLYNFSSKVLAVDGYLDNVYITPIRADKLVQNCKRLGYIHSIFNLINLVDTELFFWLEDDWSFSKSIYLEPLIELLCKYPDWVQIRLSKTAPLTTEEKKTALSMGIFDSICGFSANPCLCRTELVKAGFKALIDAPKGSKLGVDGFENFLTRWYFSQNNVCAVVDPGDLPTVIHMGALESTPRQWHMTASLDGEVEQHLYALGEIPPLWRRFSMVYKLSKTLLKIGISQFWSLAAYELAFRITTVSKEDYKLK